MTPLEKLADSVRRIKNDTSLKFAFVDVVCGEDAYRRIREDIENETAVTVNQFSYQGIPVILDPNRRSYEILFQVNYAFTISSEEDTL